MLQEDVLTREQSEVIRRTEQFVKDTLGKDSTGHDWWHIERVRNNAVNIANSERQPNDLFVVQLAALLHDIADWKFNGGDLNKGSKISRQWLEQQEVSAQTIEHVCEIIETISFKGAGVKAAMRTLEGKIVQDADRLDALGAIGIARAFAYGGHKNRALYDPTVPPENHDTFEQYKNSQGHTINHFYEKLLLLKDRMNTEAGRAIAEKRHAYLAGFLEQFLSEWTGRD
jgi:uncharacterized protein